MIFKSDLLGMINDLIEGYNGLQHDICNLAIKSERLQEQIDELKKKSKKDSDTAPKRRGRPPKTIKIKDLDEEVKKVKQPRDKNGKFAKSK